MSSDADKSLSDQVTAVARPAFATIDRFVTISGLSRRTIYDELGRGNLKAVKRGTRTLIDVDAGLTWLRSLPAAKIKAQKPRTSTAEAA